MKRAVIIHCWGGVPEYCWYPWVKKELEERGFEVLVPAFPDTDNPKMNEWLPLLQKVASEPSEELYLIGHSLGCITIMRYLESLAENQKIGGAVFVAGFNENVGFEEIKSFFETPMNLEKIKDKVKNGFVAIHSDDDPYVDLRYADVFKEKLGAEIIIKHNAKHFSGAVEGEETCVELPDVVRSIDKFIK
jgi:uncharacterized protein